MGEYVCESIFTLVRSQVLLDLNRFRNGRNRYYDDLNNLVLKTKINKELNQFFNPSKTMVNATNKNQFKSYEPDEFLYESKNLVSKPSALITEPPTRIM